MMKLSLFTCGVGDADAEISTINLCLDLCIFCMCFLPKTPQWHLVAMTIRDLRRAIMPLTEPLTLDP